MKPESQTRGNAELVANLKRRGIRERDAEAFLADFAAVVTEALAAGDEIPLHLFGKFSVRDCPMRMVRNPRTKVPSYILPHRAVHFRASTALREALNGRKPGKGFGHG